MSKGDIFDGLLPSSSVELATEADPSSAMCAEVYDLIRTIRDPEKPQNLEELDVVRESDVRVEYLGNADWPLISIQFTPTVPHCSLATLIGLCIRVKLERNFASVYRYKLDICIKKGSHSTEDDINKQINDKERIAAALENPSLLELVESCIEGDP